MEKLIVIRYGEIHLKGNNRGYFEKLLEENIKNALKEYEFIFTKIQGRYLVEGYREEEEELIISALKKVSGIHTMSKALKVQSDMDKIYHAAESILPKDAEFKVETNRADKRFPLISTEISRAIGGRLLSKSKERKVNVNTPSFIVNIDVRESGESLVYSEVIKGMGGMPTGSSGKGVLLISGGIDSPVAGYMMAKRGMKLEAVHFHSFPYTGEAAKQKVVDLCKIVSGYSGGIKLNVVPFTKIQEAIHYKCPEEMMITMMRRFMMRIAERKAVKCGAGAIITGESLGQVASQTLESITSSNSVVKMPVFRPLIGMDKLEIIDIAEKIGTYETSILPYEDCCTVFLPKHPLIKPRLDKVMAAEKNLDVERLIEEAMSNTEVYEF